MVSLREKLSKVVLRRIRARREPASASFDGQRNGRVILARPHLREASFSDFSQVAKLKERSGLAPDSIENWDRLWRDNPALHPTEPHRPIGWVLEVDREIVGYLGSIPLQCYLGNRRLQAVAAHGFVVDQAYRALALSLAAAFYSQKGIDLYLTTSAIETTAKLAILFKSAQVPQADYDTVFFWVLRAHPFSRMVVRKLDLSPTLSSVSTLGISLAIGTHRLIRNPVRRLRRPMYVREMRMEAIDQEFLRLWHQKTQEQRCLLTDRSPEMLRWHFRVPGDQGCVTVLGCYPDERLEGYAVLRTDTDRQTDLRKSVIADMLVKNNDADVTRALLTACYKYAVREKSDVFEVQGFPPQLRSVFSEFRPHSRKYPACPYYFKAADPELQKQLEDPSAWYACPYDGDATLIRPSYSTSLNGNERELESIASEIS